MIKERTGSLLLYEEAGAGMFDDLYENCQQGTARSGIGETQPLSEKALSGQQLEETAVHVVMPASCHGKRETDRLSANLVAVLATVLIILAIGLLAFKKNHLSYKNQSVRMLYQGAGPRLLLPDGTRVWLSAGSRLSYSREFGNAGREVVLEGAAFFNVADGAHPFVVHTGVLDVEGSGAAFSLRAYKSEPVTEAALERGQAVLQLKACKRKKMFLQLNERVTCSNTNGSQVDPAEGKGRQ